MKILIVVDMLNDFIKEDGLLYCGPTAKAIVPFVKAKIEEVLAERGEVVFLTDNHDENDKEFTRFPKHCVAGTHGAELIDELKEFLEEYPDQTIIIPKKRYSGMFNTDLGNHIDDVINARGEEGDIFGDDLMFELVGVCTSICVMDTVGALANADERITVYKDGVADFDQEAHAFALKRMEKLYGAKIL